MILVNHSKPGEELTGSYCFIWIFSYYNRTFGSAINIQAKSAVGEKTPHLTHFKKLALAVFVLLSSLFSVGALDFGRMQNVLSQRFGPVALTSFENWQRLLHDNADQPILVQVSQVNTFFNRRIKFDDDQIVWGQSEYWATPMETLGKGAGDCEDFAIVKYFTLLQLGIPDERLRLVYVHASLGGSSSNITQAHMVLAFYPAGNTDPLILDNLQAEVQPASRRPDLLPVFSFNGQGIWQGASGARGPGGPGSLSRWQDLLQRARAEGF